MVAAAADERSEGAAAKEKSQAPQLPVRVVAALESFVVSEAHKTYARMFAFFKLLKVWACLRFDDHRGLVPAGLHQTPDGLHGKLVRTKTSGVGKAREVLVLFVSSNAWLVESSWLTVGWKLWEAVHPDRDYFLGLPSDDMSSMRPVEAKYVDGLAMSRALLASLPGPDGKERLLSPGLERFWSEHSERATLPSWVSMLACFPADWIDLLGRWSARTSENYVRTAVYRIKQMQDAVAGMVRSSTHPSGALGEAILLRKSADWMCAQGWGAPEAADQCAVLRNWVVPEAAASPTEVADTDGEEEKAPFRFVGDEPLPADAAEDAASLSAMPTVDAPTSRLVVVDPDAAPPAMGMFVVSVQSRSRFRRLHRIGSCGRLPGIHYLEYLVLGDSMPGSSSFDACCRQCFPEFSEPAGLEEEAASSGSSSDE